MTSIRSLAKASLLLMVALPLAAARADCPIPKNFGCRDLRFNPEPPGELEGVSDLRRAIVEAAQSRIGQVSELRQADGTKCGWEHLTAFYDAAYEQGLPVEAYATLKRPMSIHTLIDPETGAPKINPAHPDPRDPRHLMVRVNEEKVNEWCGIFALWAVKKGGRAVGSEATAGAWWKPRRYGWGVDGLTFVSGSDGIQPGDIAYFRGALQHQAIVERVTDGKIYTIDGNQQCQQIGRRASDIRTVAGYYRAD